MTGQVIMDPNPQKWERITPIPERAAAKWIADTAPNAFPDGQWPSGVLVVVGQDELCLAGGEIGLHN